MMDDSEGKLKVSRMSVFGILVLYYSMTRHGPRTRAHHNEITIMDSCLLVLLYIFKKKRKSPILTSFLINSCTTADTTVTSPAISVLCG